MRFLITRESEGEVSAKSPCPGAIRGSEATAWPGEYEWFIEVGSLEELMALLERTGGALALFAPEEGASAPVIEILDEDMGNDED